MVIKRFEDIVAWQKAKVLTIFMYKEFKNCRDFSFKDQIQRASVSVMNNIAEGFDRRGDKQFKNFLFIALGSAAEVKSMLYVALELGYISKDAFQSHCTECVTISKMVTGLIKSIS